MYSDFSISILRKFLGVFYPVIFDFYVLNYCSIFDLDPGSSVSNVTGRVTD
jgi:hypothetical protein